VQSDFAEWLKSILSGTAIRFVDVWPATNRIPNVIAFESEKLVEIRRQGRTATWLRPQSRLAELFGSNVSWMVDLVEDASKQRSPFELMLPPVRTSTEILNAPNPPTVTHSSVPLFGRGFDSVNVRCTKREELIRHWLPTDREILEELLYQRGLRFKEDEKRACYLPAIKLLGGLDQASSALSGVRGRILQELARGPATVHEIKGRLQLGNGKIQELNRDRYFELMLQYLTPTQTRIGRQRLRHYWRKTLPRDTKLQSLLEHWVSNGILRRLFRIGSCPNCQTTHHEPRIHIARPYQCPGCGASIPMAESQVVEYQLQPILEAALRQGLMPVALTGRFLRNLTSRGFLWLPGLKYSHEGIHGDIDVIASCDGHLVMAECKSRDQSDPSTIEWGKIVEQVMALTSVAKACRVSFVVFASMVDDYPPEIRDRIESLGTADLKVHLLNGDDLEKGHRPIQPKPLPTTVPASLLDFVPDPFPEVTFPRFDEPREIAMGFMTHTIGAVSPPFPGQAEPDDSVPPDKEETE
jgi:hypothetical protein